MVGKLVKNVFDVILPPIQRCQLCGHHKASDEYGLCTVCRKELDYWDDKYHECSLCGRFIAQEGLCGRCRKNKPLFAAARSVGPYRGILKDCLNNLKFRGSRGLAVPLGKLLAHKLRSAIKVSEIAFIAPVPMHPDKEEVRGFNQAVLLAREVGRELGIPVLEGLLCKNRDTVAQIHLSSKERTENLTGSFTVAPGEEHLSEGKVILLVDDIMTTGSTVKECSRELLDAGAQKVIVGTVATGIHFSPTNNPH